MSNGVHVSRKLESPASHGYNLLVANVLERKLVHERKDLLRQHLVNESAFVFARGRSVCVYTFFSQIMRKGGWREGESERREGGS